MKSVTVLLDDDLMAIIERWGIENDRSLSESMRHGLRMFFMPSSSETKTRRGRLIFQPPETEEIRSHLKEKGYSFSAESFVAFYESKGWKVGNQPMRDWKAACLTWERRRLERASLTKAVPPEPPPKSHAITNDDLKSEASPFRDARKP